MTALPSRRRCHDCTANAVVALLDTAWRCRMKGDRKTMRGLALSARALVALWKVPKVIQQELAL